MDETDRRLTTLERDVSVLQKICVSKSELSATETTILAKISETEDTLREEIRAVDGRITAVACRLRVGMSGVGNSLRTEINGVRQDLRTEISQAKNWIVFWVVTSVLLAHFLPTF